MIKDIARRLARKILTGIVRLSYDDTGLQTLQATFMSGDTWEKIPHYQNYGFTHRPHKGAQAVGLFIDEDNGLVIAVEDRRYRLKKLKEGEVALYDDTGNLVKLGRESLTLKSPKKIIVEAPETTVKSDLTEFFGRVKANGKYIDDQHGHIGDSGGQIQGVT